MRRDALDVGFLGGGQLARMSLAPATALGLSLTILCRDFGESAALAWPDIMLGSPDDIDAVTSVARRCSVLTFDHELVDVGNIRLLETQGYRFAPSTSVLAVAQSKVMQREQFRALGLPIPPFAVIEPGDSLELVESFASEHSWPIMIKADRGGYDGRGVWRVSNAVGAGQIASELHQRRIAIVLEEVMPLDVEVAILVARNWSGEIATYPLVETQQLDGMLRSLRAPARVDHVLQDQAAEIARCLASAIDVVGLLAVEYFVSDHGLVVNEIATRPHNSGHYTIEGAVTSQFEQHLRAVHDLPLGSTEMTFSSAATVNVVGRLDPAGIRQALAIPGAHVHLYGKAPREGRKLGHVTVCGEDPDEVFARATRAALLLEGRGG